MSRLLSVMSALNGMQTAYLKSRSGSRLGVCAGGGGGRRALEPHLQQHIVLAVGHRCHQQHNAGVRRHGVRQRGRGRGIAVQRVVQELERTHVTHSGNTARRAPKQRVQATAQKQAISTRTRGQGGYDYLRVRVGGTTGSFESTPLVAAGGEIGIVDRVEVDGAGLAVAPRLP